MANGLVNYGLLDPSLANALSAGYDESIQRGNAMARDKQALRLGEIQMQNALREQRLAAEEEAAYKTAGGDMRRLQQELFARGLGKQGMSVGQQISAADAAKLARAKDVLDLTKRAATAIMAAPDHDTAVSTITNLQRLTGQDMSSDLAQLNSFGGDPVKIRAWAAGHAADADKLLPKFEQFRVPGQGVQTGTTDPVSGRFTPGALYKETATPGELLTDARLRNEAAAEGTGALSHDAMVNAAARYNLDGSLPPLGMGKSAANTRTAILSMAAELNKGADPTDQRLRHISTKANASALAQLTKQETMVGAFEKNFTKNADLVLGLNDTRNHSGVPVAQRWLNAGRKAIEGDPDLRKFDIGIKAVVNEYAKIISGAMGNTQVALGEIKRLEDKLNSAQTPAEVKAVVEFMKLESANRMAGFKEQRDELTGEISGKPKGTPKDSKPAVAPPGGAAPATNAKGWTLHTDKNGNRAYVSPDGKQFEEVK